MTVQEFVNIDKDLQTVQDISDVNIIILIYSFIKHVLFIVTVVTNTFLRNGIGSKIIL
jgi:cytochrome c oxidase assembly protein Cox11